MTTRKRKAATQGPIGMIRGVGIVATAAVATATILGFIWRRVEAPMIAHADEIDRRHTAIEQKLSDNEEKLTALLGEHEAHDQEMDKNFRVIVRLLAVPPGSPERARLAQQFERTHTPIGPVEP